MKSHHKHAAGADGTRLYVRTRAGKRDASEVTSILCDGIACDGFIWKYLWDDLAAHGPVAHFNYRGHGRSARPASPERIELTDHASDLDAVRLSLGDPPCVLFGHSMGCQVILEAFRQRPEGVRALVLLCGSSGRVTHTFKGSNMLAQMLPGLIESVDAHKDLARAIWSRVSPEMALRIGRLTGEFDVGNIQIEDLVPYVKHMVDIDLPMFLRMLRSAGDHSALDVLPTVNVPALVIAGDRDTFTPPQYAEEMAAALPQGELLVLPGATHAAPLERKDVVDQRIEQFLRERVGV